MKAVRIVACVFLALGLLMVLVGYVGSEENAAYFRRAQSVQGELTVVDRSNEACEVSYVVDGREYSKRLNLYESSMRVGQPVNVYFEAQSPESIRTDYSDLPFFILRIIGVCFAGAAALACVLGMLARSSRERLLREGTRITAHVEEIALNRTVTVNGRHPWRIVCRATDPTTGQERLFYSSNLYEDPTGRLHGDQVQVAVDGRRYAVDLAGILEGAED